MGRGLSELQKTMLTMPPDESGMIYVRDVITKYYGWKQGPNGHFNKTAIGPKTYMSVYIAIRKSIKRLEDRHLIWCIGRSRFDLTTKGRELSAKLKVKPLEPLDESPQGEDLMAKLGQTSAKKAGKDLLAKLPGPAPIIEVKDTIAPIDKPIKRTSDKKRREILEYVLAELQAGREPRISDVAAKFETPTAIYEIWLPLAVNIQGGRIHNTKKGIKAIKNYISYGQYL